MTPPPEPIKSVIVFHGEYNLGEIQVFPSNTIKETPATSSSEAVVNWDGLFPNGEIRISHISVQSERCAPLAIIQTINPFGVKCKLKAKPLSSEQAPLNLLYSTCYNELKTAVVLLGGDEEIHLVAMASRDYSSPSFWCCSVPLDVYGASVNMLNQRCLAIVFDLDETLVVANTMKSFDDRIDQIQRRIAGEKDQGKVLALTAELKRYLDDKMMLKQYSESDFVMDDGKFCKVQPEPVPPSSTAHEQVFRPVIRLQEKNIVLTRINPEVRDTSVLVRLRPAWDFFRSYLTAKGRKRFEVYVCTMAERNYALEMWRLLDTEAQLINPTELLTRVVCVKSDGRKSLLNVFQASACDPKMAMVIDDRLNVWEEKDQSRVHVVPAFAPYYAPQAEAGNGMPVLCLARNIVSNIRTRFFKEFDENLSKRVSELCHEDEVAHLQFTPDVRNCMLEDVATISNNNKDIPFPEGMVGAETERRLNQPDGNRNVESASPFVANTALRPDVSQQLLPGILGPATSSRPLLPLQKPLLPGALVRREFLPPSTYNGGPPLLSRPPSQQMPPPVLPLAQPHGGWLVDENSSSKQLNNRVPDSNGLATNQVSTINRDLAAAESGRVALSTPSISVGVLQEIGRRCGSKVEFKSIMSTGKDLQFSVEVMFDGEKIGVGMCKTKKDALQQAAESALRSLAEDYVSHIRESEAVNTYSELGMHSDGGDENGFLMDDVSNGLDTVPRNDLLANVSTPEVS